MDQPLASPVVSQRIRPRVRLCGLILLSMDIQSHHRRDSPRRPFIKQENEIPGCYHSHKDSQIQLLLFPHALPRNLPMPRMARL